jgi:hypothetical protein
MPTLNIAKNQTKTLLKLAVIFLIIIIIFPAGIKYIKDLNTPPTPPTASFGKLPPVVFPNQAKENITYSVDTLSGYLPTFSDRAKVYRITTYPPTLLGLVNSQKKVAGIGFSSQGSPISENTYQWVDKNLQKTITMDIYSSNFTFSSPYLTTSYQALSGVQDQNGAIDTAKSFLSQMSMSLPIDIDESKTKTSLYSIEAGAFIPVDKISDAKIVSVAFLQKDVDSLPIYYQGRTSSTIDFWVGKENNALEVVKATFLHRNISDVFSTYAIKTDQQAYSELQGGQAFIVDKDPNISEITIKNVSLGYYIGEADQSFLMPIIVFEGTNNFLAYVSAVRDEWIGN